MFDDTFVIFQNAKESEEFLIKLNRLHPSLQFTFEKEKNNFSIPRRPRKTHEDQL